MGYLETRGEYSLEIELIDHEELPKTVKKKKRMIVPSPDQLERAFKKQWTPNHELNLGEFVQGTVAAYDTFIWGCRSIEDHNRIKGFPRIQAARGFFL